MPLHDWTDRRGWDGVHQLWNVAIVHSLKPILPPNYRVYLGTVPALTVAAPQATPDVNVRNWLPVPDEGPAASAPETPAVAVQEPERRVAVLALDPQYAVHVTLHDRLVAAVELISPRNKDRPEAREAARNRYASYLIQGVHLVLVDVHRRPLRFSFPDAIAAALGFADPPWPPPLAVVYRVEEPAAEGGRMLGLWRRSLAVGQPLPTLPLPLSLDQSVPLDLEATYTNAASAAYLD